MKHYTYKEISDKFNKVICSNSDYLCERPKKSFPITEYKTYVVRGTGNTKKIQLRIKCKLQNHGLCGETVKNMMFNDDSYYTDRLVLLINEMGCDLQNPTVKTESDRVTFYFDCEF